MGKNKNRASSRKGKAKSTRRCSEAASERDSERAKKQREERERQEAQREESQAQAQQRVRERQQERRRRARAAMLRRHERQRGYGEAERGGVVSAWGYNDAATCVLGLGDEDERENPALVRFPGRERLVSVVAGYDHVMAITDMGELMAWGCGKHGCLGNGDTVLQASPVRVEGLAGRVQQVATGKHFTAAIVGNPGKLFTWGRNKYGQLGFSSCCDTLEPVEVVIAGVTSVVGVATGQHHTIVHDGNNVLGFGSNVNGQLGFSPSEFKRSHTPRKFPLQGDTPIFLIGAGKDFSSVLCSTMLALQQCISFACAMHPRLGRSSPARKLSYPLFQEILHLVGRGEPILHVTEMGTIHYTKQDIPPLQQVRQMSNGSRSICLATDDLIIVSNAISPSWHIIPIQANLLCSSTFFEDPLIICPGRDAPYLMGEHETTPEEERHVHSSRINTMVRRTTWSRPETEAETDACDDEDAVLVSVSASSMEWGELVPTAHYSSDTPEARLIGACFNAKSRFVVTL
ncbi:Ultraviolet-B receptor UVR8 [Pelomyxa schiedti]|nr:Ultraviolet-B receptor UVR8 [Pelomyxa schiedti]